MAKTELMILAIPNKTIYYIHKIKSPCDRTNCITFPETITTLVAMIIVDPAAIQFLLVEKVG